MKTTAIIVAAGRGSRMGAEQNKVFLPLLDSTVIEHTLAVFSKSSVIDEIIVVTRECDLEEMSRLCEGISKIKKIISGGAERQESVSKGLSAADGADLAVIHDGARALITDEIIKNTLSDAVKYKAAAAGVLCKDTLKSADENGFITATLDRSTTYLIQTPQVFAFDEITRVHSLAEKDGFLATDDCALYEKYLGRVKISEGSYENLKLTTPEDMEIAERILIRRKGL